MRKRSLFCVCVAALASDGLRAEDFLDRVDQALTFSTLEDRVRLRLSGTTDLEYYHLEQPTSGLINTSSTDLFNPRLTLFLDAQLGPRVYFFAQSRVDRSFDPADKGARVRLDEYALRLTPWEDGRFSLQIGKFSPVIGNWMSRHLSWDNPFINPPLPYDFVTAISDFEVPTSPRDFVAGQGGGNYEYNPIIWSAAYATGISISGRLDKFEFAAEMKNIAPTARPESWDAKDTGLSHPTFSGRAGMRPNTLWNLGFSASHGPYMRPEAAPLLPPGRGIGDYNQSLLGQDISFEWHHLQLWAEFYECRFEVPNVGHADTFAYYMEAKYKFTPEFFGALRWNQQFFAKVPDGAGGRIDWGHDVWRADASLGYRFTPHTQLKLQYSIEHETSRSPAYLNMIAAQFTVRF